MNNKQLLALVLISALLIFALAPVWAGPEGPKETAIAKNSIGPENAVTTSTVEERRFDIDADGTDVKYILEALARQSGENIVVSPDVSGELSVHLTQKTLPEILDYVSVVGGFAWKKSDNTYLVMNKENMPEEVDQKKDAVPIKTMVWHCRHLKPDELVTSLGELFPEVKFVTAPEPSSPPVESMESSLPGSSSTSSTPTTSSSSEKKTSRIIVMGPEDKLPEIKMLLDEIDQPRKLISIEVQVCEVRDEGEENIGVEWGWDTFVFQLSTGAWNPVQDINARKFTATIQALIKDDRAKLLAAPNLSVLDGEAAKVLIGDRVKYPRLAQRDSFGQPIYEIAEEEVGISLQIAPRVTEEDTVMLRLYPQVSIISGYLKFQGSDYPQVSTREAQTTVLVKTGTTIAIGGLLRDDEIVNAQKIPLMGDLPIIGHLFRSKKVTTERTNIVILLTPKITSEV